jgi:multisubunit Na+/H+ antiporter MnhE subunit
MRVLQHFIIALPVAIVWVLLTKQPNIAGILIGYTIGVTLSWLLSQGEVLPPITMRNLPQRIFAFSWYTVRMVYNIFMSGIDVTLRLAGVRPLRAGIIAVPVQNDDEAEEVYRTAISGLSAHSITITPGELVVDFSEDMTIMYVHALDVEQVAPRVEGEQARRAAELRRIFARD